jgi:hypothetical protein
MLDYWAHMTILSAKARASAHKKKPQKKKNQTLSKFVISAL